MFLFPKWNRLHSQLTDPPINMFDHLLQGNVTDFNHFEFKRRGTSRVGVVLRPFIYPVSVPAVFCSSGSKPRGNTQNRSGVYHRLTQLRTHIHTSEESRPDLRVFGLQEKTAAPRGKALWCQVKFICAAQYHIKYLCGHHGFTTALVPDPAPSLRRQGEAGKKELLKKEEETSGDTFSKTIPFLWQMEEKGKKEQRV